MPACSFIRCIPTCSFIHFLQNSTMFFYYYYYYYQQQQQQIRFYFALLLMNICYQTLGSVIVTANGYKWERMRQEEKENMTSGFCTFPLGDSQMIKGYQSISFRITRGLTPISLLFLWQLLGFQHPFFMFVYQILESITFENLGQNRGLAGLACLASLTCGGGPADFVSVPYRNEIIKMHQCALVMYSLEQWNFFGHYSLLLQRPKLVVRKYSLSSGNYSLTCNQQTSNFVGITNFKN